MTAAEIAAKLDANARQDGSDWRCQCPLCQHGSLALRDHGDKLLVKCWNGCPSAAIRAELKRGRLYGSVNGDGANSSAAPETRAQHEANTGSAKAKHQARIDDAMDVWRNSFPATNTMVEVYFASGLILNSPPPALRFVPAIYNTEAKIHYPAVVGLVEHVDHGPTGIHLIALNALDASVRPALRKRKWSRGPVNAVQSVSVRQDQLSEWPRASKMH